MAFSSDRLACVDASAAAGIYKDVASHCLGHACTVSAHGWGWETHQADRAQVVPTQLPVAPLAADDHERVAPRADALPVLLLTVLHVYGLPQQHCRPPQAHDALPKQRARACNVQLHSTVVLYKGMSIRAGERARPHISTRKFGSALLAEPIQRRRPTAAVKLAMTHAAQQCWLVPKVCLPAQKECRASHFCVPRSAFACATRTAAGWVSEYP